MKLAVADLMTENVFALTADDSIKAARGLMDSCEVHHLPVVNESAELIGILSSHDLASLSASRDELTLDAAEALEESATVGELASREPITVSPNDDVAEAGATMLDQGISCVPVVEGRRLVGILTKSDFVRFLALRAPNLSWHEDDTTQAQENDADSWSHTAA